MPATLPQPGTLPQPAAPEVPRKPADKLKFQFKFQPWKDVLEWFADQADLSLLADSTPKGTFNYSDSREYTPTEAIDLLNSVLLMKGYTLVRQNQMLVLVNLEDGIPANLVSTVSLDELDKRGEFELVRTLFSVDKLTPEEADLEVKKLLGPQGSVVVLPKSKQIQVTETAGRLRTIRRVIELIENPEGPGQVRIYELKHLRPQEALVVLRQLLDVPLDKNATTDGSVRFAVDADGKKILVTGRPDAVSRVQEILKAIDGEGGKGTLNNEPQLEVYPITSADPAAVLQVMQTLLAGETEVRLAIDSKTGSLVALAKPEQQATIRGTLEQLQRDARKVEVIQLRTLDVQLAGLAITKLFGGEAASAPKVDVDPTSRQLMIRGSDAQLLQIRGLLEKMGESLTEGPRTGGSNVRMLPLTGRSARTALERMQEIWPTTLHANPIRVVTPSAVIPTMRPSETPGAPREPAANPPAVTPAPSVLPAPEPRVDPKPADPTAANRRRVRAEFVAESEWTAKDEKTTAKQPADTTPAKPESKSGKSPIIVSPGPGGIMIASEDIEALNAFEEMLSSMAGGASLGKPELTIFYLRHAKAAVVAETLEQIFSGGGASSEGGGGSLLGDLAGAALGNVGGGVLGSLLGGGGGAGGGSIKATGTVQITPDPRLNALVVNANPADLDTVEELLKILDQPGSPEDVAVAPKPRMIPVFNQQASEISEVVKQVYQDRMVAGAGGQARQPSPQEFIQMLRGGRGGGRGQRGGGAQEDTQKMSIGVDARTNSLVVAAPDQLFQEVKALVEQLDQGAAESGEVMQIVTLRRTSPEAVSQALTAIAGSNVQVGRSGGGTPPSSGTSQTPSDGSRRRSYGGFGGFGMPGGMGGMPGGMPGFGGMSPGGGSDAGSRSYGGGRSRRSRGGG